MKRSYQSPAAEEIIVLSESVMQASKEDADNEANDYTENILDLINAKKT